MYFYLVKTKWYDDDGRKEREEYCIFHGGSFNDIMNEVTRYYGEDTLIDVSIEILNEGPAFHIDEAMIARLKEKNMG